MEHWRVMNRAEIVARASKLLVERLRLGKKRYDSDRLGFQGHPVKHLGEEIGDTFVYFHKVEDYVEELEETIEQQKRRIEELEAKVEE